MLLSTPGKIEVFVTDKIGRGFSPRLVFSYSVFCYKNGMENNKYPPVKRGVFQFRA